MSQEFHYSTPETPAGPGSDVVIAGSIQIDPSHQFQETAALGEAPVVNVNVDDPQAIYDLVGLKRFYVVETECPPEDNLIWTGYVKDQSITRGTGDTLFPIAAGRRYALELEEVNSIIGFRRITGTDGKRPAETAAERLTWLMLASDYLMTVNDNGLVNWTGLEAFDMDANDYRPQTAQDVLSDIAVQSAYLYFAFYDKDADDDSRISLFFDDPDSRAYASDIRISNYAADEGEADVYPPWEGEAEEKQSPDRVAAGVVVPYSGGFEYDYNYDTAQAFGFRDQLAPMASVKTAEKARALVARFLAEHNEQTMFGSCRITMPAANVNDVKRGHVLQARFEHFRPPYNDWFFYRVTRKTIAPPENSSQAVYDVHLELSPIGGGEPSGAFDFYIPGSSSPATPPLPSVTTPGRTLLMLVSISRVDTGAPSTPIFYKNLDTTPATDSSWTEHVFEPLDNTVASRVGIGAGIYSRIVQPGEVTMHPVGVLPVDNLDDRVSIHLWELPEGGGIPTDVTSTAERGMNEGAVRVVGSALTGFVVGAIVWSVPPNTHRITVTPTDGHGTTLQSASGINDGRGPGELTDYPGPGFYGVDTPWTWIGTRDGTGTLAAYFTSPLNPGLADIDVVAVAAVIPGITSLKHINYVYSESPPNVTPE